MKFTQATCREVKADILDALAVVEKKHGVKFETGRGRFDPTTFEFTLRAGVVGDGGVNLGAQNDFNQVCFMYGLEPKHFQAEFSYAGKRWRLDSINTRARRWPFNVTELGSGDQRRLPAETAELIKSQFQPA